MKNKIGQKMNRKMDNKTNNDNSKALNKDATLLLLTSTLFTIAVALSNTFVNVYLWKLENNFLLIGWFNFTQYTATMFIYIVVGKLAKKIDRVLLLRSGVLILALFYLVVLLLGKAAADYYVVLGLLLGIGQGLYWFSFDILYFEITEPDTRDIFNGWHGLLTSGGGIIAPFLSGWFISHRTGITGYRTIFFVSLLIFFLAVIVSFFFYRKKSFGKYRLKEVIKQASGKTNWRYITLGMVAQGGREGVITFLVGLLIYVSTKSEFSLGKYSMIISAVSSVTYFMVGRFIKKKWRSSSMMVGTFMMAVVVLPMFLNINYTTLLIYGVGTSIFAPLYFIPLTSIIFDVIGENETTASLREEYIVLHEIGLNIGRLLITLLFIYFAVKIGAEHFRYLLLLSGSLQIATWFFMKSVKIGNTSYDNNRD